ncbi:malectin domain-containing carbohydrate-binding protein [Pontibacter chitinilyticus]|uniref:malectin domain-containing carbohydrate-binding protein n=1 Tax=Pontibacter chitinilyticus TaxID=2674989 RepID=UPI00321B5844
MIVTFTKNSVGQKICLLLLILCFYRAPEAQAQSINFSSSNLKGVSLTNPTSLQFGPDNRLYVAQQNGILKAYKIQRNGANDYTVTATETINLINQIPNHNDNGALNTSVTTRQVTGLLVTGTSSNPVLYVTSSDSRMGGPSGDLNLDTNSGIISKLTWTGSAWDKVDLVRGLPRSEENHAPNGMQLDEQKNILYVAVGGFTNAGSPSINFAYICEYALSAAILSVDLNAIDAMSTKGSGSTKYKYDLPTLDDPTRTNTSGGTDQNDPFGGNNGLNQAKLVAGGPVQVYSAGYRNPYDLIITKTPGKARRMYTVDNGANQGWGGYPDHEGTDGTVTNKYVSGEPGSSGPGVNDPQVNNLDNFHYVGNIDNYTPGSMYAGHPDPIRANPSGAGLYTRSGSTGVWRSSKSGSNPLPADWPPVPLSMAKKEEGDFQNPGETDNALLTFTYSTNGITEYTASNFGNALKGNLLVASYNGDIHRIRLNDAGDGVLNSKGSSKLNKDAPFASNFGSEPLDIVAQGDDEVFPGSVWAATYGANGIAIFEPNDYASCSGQYSTSLDDDGDGYSNADEIDNHTNPCSASSKPADNDKDQLSDLKDTDDDNDGLPDTSDYFVLDAQNGLDTRMPIRYDLYNNNPGTGFFGLGFTGLMSNNTNYSNLYDENNLIAGGTAGALSVVNVTAGDAYEGSNSQQSAFQFGVNVSSGSGPFTVEGRMTGTFFNGNTPVDYQSQGIYIGTGDQDNYLKIVLNANGGAGGILVMYEEDGVATSKQYALSGGIPSSTLDLFLAINPATGTVQPKYATNGGSVVNVGTPIQLKGNVLAAVQGTPALAVGILSTSDGATPFTANWDYVYVTPDQITATGDWQTITPSSGTPVGREENAYVQVGSKFYLIGGRGIKPVQVYDPATKVWANKANTPMELHHFQAVAVDGLIYVIGAFTGSYPSETPVPNVYIYNPLTDKWYKGPVIPSARRRGSAGAVLRDGKIYLAGGIVNGHRSGFVNWFDVYDPRDNTWQTLPNAPRTRDHFQAGIIGNKLYLAGGRRTSYDTGQTFSLTVPEVDVYDFTSGSWATLPSSSNIPTQRAGAATVVLGEELLVIGGESTQPAGHRETEALNVQTKAWRKLALLNQGRHGTQAIESNSGIYIVSGAGNQGGSPLLSSQESFFLFGPTNPFAPLVSQSQLTAPTSINFGEVAANTSSSKTITLANTSGTQAIVISSLSTSGAGTFAYKAPHDLPFVIPAGQSVSMSLTFSPTSTAEQTATLAISHSGQGGSTTVSLSGNAGGTTTNPAAYQLNSGGPAVTADGKNWAADAYFNGGKSYSNLNITDIKNTTSDALYKTERSSATPFGYAFPVNNGTYTVNLHFAEIYWGATGGGPGGVGKRIFSVNLEGGAVELQDYDIYAEVGAMTAVTKTFDVTVTDGVLNIDFSVKVDQPKVSAIEIIPVTGSPAGQQVVSMTLIDADNNQDLQTLTSGSTLNLATLPTKNLNIRANTDPATVGSVTFQLSGTQTKTVTESAKPYALFGDDTHGDYYAWAPAVGSYTLKATPYTASKGTGTAGTTLSVSFTVVNQSAADSELQVSSLTVVNADNNQDLQMLTNGAALNLASLPTKNINIRANTNPSTVGSVVFQLSGTQSKSVTESIIPYALLGDDTHGDYYAWTPAVGNYTLKATPYSASKGTGTAGTALSLNFSVVNQAGAAALVSNVAGSSGNSYGLTDLAVGRKLYTDRTYQVTSVPSVLQGAWLIQPPNADKWSTSTAVLSFTLSQPAIVYVAYDPRATALPSWLSGWTKLADRVGVDDSKISSMVLYSKSFPAGKVTLGGNMASPAAGAETNYLTMAVAAGQALVATQPLSATATQQHLRQQPDLQVFPNPVNQGERIRMEATGFAAEEDIVLTIYDVLGHSVHTRTARTNQEGGLQTEIAFMNKLATGIYLIQAEAASGKAQAKMLIR